MLQYHHALHIIFQPFVALLQIISLVVALTIHSSLIAWMADHLGDPTPPSRTSHAQSLRHLDPIGTLLLFIAGFGWGKPVEFDPYNLKRPQRYRAHSSCRTGQ